VGSKVYLGDLEREKKSSNTTSNFSVVITNMTMLQRFEILPDYFKVVRASI
jgi:hypothetical protein